MIDQPKFPNALFPQNQARIRRRAALGLGHPGGGAILATARPWLLPVAVEKTMLPAR